MLMLALSIVSILSATADECENRDTTGLSPRWYQCVEGPIVDGIPVMYCGQARLNPVCPDFEPDFNIMEEEPK